MSFGDELRLSCALADPVQDFTRHRFPSLQCSCFNPPIKVLILRGMGITVINETLMLDERMVAWLQYTGWVYRVGS